jgi:general secretion pathway protein L
VNLLQDRYAARRPESINFGRWRAVATLTAIWAGVAVVGLVAQGFWADVQADALESRSEALYRDIYPGEDRIINIRRQMSQKLGQSVDGEGRGFNEYLGYLAQGIDRNASILSLNYTQTRDELAADLLLRNYDELERMKQRLSQLGVTVEITSAEQQDTGVRARIRLKGA